MCLYTHINISYCRQCQNMPKYTCKYVHVYKIYGESHRPHTKLKFIIQNTAKIPNYIFDYIYFLFSKTYFIQTVHLQKLVIVCFGL